MGTNVVRQPGFTVFAMFLYDQNALFDSVRTPLEPQETAYIDLDGEGYVVPGVVGRAVIGAMFWEHGLFENGVHRRNLVGLSAQVVEQRLALQPGPANGSIAEPLHAPLAAPFGSVGSYLCPGLPASRPGIRPRATSTATTTPGPSPTATITPTPTVTPVVAPLCSQTAPHVLLPALSQNSAGEPCEPERFSLFPPPLECRAGAGSGM